MDPIEPWIDGNAVRRLAAQLLSSPRSSEITDSPDAGFGPGFEGFTSGASEPEFESQLPSAEAVPPPEPPPLPRGPSPHEEELQIRQRQVVPPPVTAIEPKAKEHLVEKTSQGQEDAKPFQPAASQQSAPTELDSTSDQPFQQLPTRGDGRGRDTKRGPLMERMLRFRAWLEKHAKARSVFVLDRDGQPVLDDPAYAKLHFLARSLSQAYRPVPGKPGNVHVKVGSDAYLVVIPVETVFGCLVLGAVLPRPLDAPSVEIVAKGLAEAARPRSS